MQVELDKKAYSATALCPQANMDSSSRKYMFFTQMGNAVSIKNPDTPYIISTLEKEFREMNYHHRIRCKFEVIAILPYFELGKGTYGEIEDATYVNVIYKNLDENKLGFIKVDRWGKKDKKFGYEQKFTKDMMNLREGGIYDTLDLTSTNAEKDGIFAYGKNCSIMYTSKSEVAEDAFYISDAYQDMFEMDLFSSFKTYSDGRTVLLNVHGDENEYKPLPRVGDIIGSGALVMATREMDDDNFLSNCSYKDLSYVDYIHDHLYKVDSPAARVVDVTVLHNPDGKKTNTLSVAHDMLMELAMNKKSFDLNFINRCKHYSDTHRDVDFENELYVELVRLQKLYHPKVDRQVKKQRVPTFTIEITLQYTRKVNVGFKQTTTHGSKGVISVVVPKEMMPVDANGIRADIMIVSNSNMHRMNLGNLGEGYVGTAVRVLDMKIKAFINTRNGSVKEFVNDNLSELDRMYIGLFKLVNPEKAMILENAKPERRARMYLSFYKSHISYPIPLGVKGEDGKATKFSVIMDKIRESEYAIKEEVVKIPTSDGGYEMSVMPTHVHTQYMFSLNKIADDGLVVASSRLNPLGIPVAPPTSQKEGSVINEKSTKWSETETRFVASYCHPAVLAEMRDRSLAMKTKYHIARKLLDEPKPSNIDKIVNRKEIPFGEEVVLKTLKGITQSIGLNLKGIVRDKD
jgi:hypothetical protein